jgi:hypothetical protein
MRGRLLAKLTSRKLWIAVGTVAALLLQDTPWAAPAAAAVTAVYVIAEALVDGMDVKHDTDA